MQNDGFITLPRGQIRKPYLKRKCYDEDHAWIDLICLAAYKDMTFNHKGANINLKRGELITSTSKLAIKWNWSKATVNRFLKNLEEHEDIKVDYSRKGTRIEIVDYEKIFQAITSYKFNYESQCESYSEPQNEPQNEPHSALEPQGIARIREPQNEPQNEPPMSHKMSHEMSHEMSHTPPSNHKELRESVSHEMSHKVSHEMSHNKQLSNIELNSVCVKEPPQEFLKLFTREQYNELVNKHTQEYTDRVIREMIDYSKNYQVKIANPMSLFKTWNPKNKNKQNQKQTPSQRKPGQNKFNNFQQRDYDMDELEQKLLGV